MPSPLLVAAFGGQVTDISKVVDDHDFNQTISTDPNRIDYLHTSLAPSLGEITSGAVQKMDDYLKVMISGLMHTLAKIPPAERTWDKILSATLQNPVIKLHHEAPISRRDHFDNVGTHAFKFNGDPDAVIAKKVNEWFNKFISDGDVLKTTKIDIKALAKIVAQSGATIDSFESFFKKDERHSKTVVDIGVLRFPSIAEPYFQMYRIKLRAWSDCTRTLFMQDDANGIEGEYDSRKFIPDPDIIKDLNKEVHKKAVDEANHLFD